MLRRYDYLPQRCFSSFRDWLFMSRREVGIFPKVEIPSARKIGNVSVYGCACSYEFLHAITSPSYKLYFLRVFGFELEFELRYPNGIVNAATK